MNWLIITQSVIIVALIITIIVVKNERNNEYLKQLLFWMNEVDREQHKRIEFEIELHRTRRKNKRLEQIIAEKEELLNSK